MSNDSYNEKIELEHILECLILDVLRSSYVSDADFSVLISEYCGRIRNSLTSVRTCHDIHEPPKHSTFWPAPHFKCSECNETHVSLDYVDYCPRCGAKVID